MRVIRYYQYGPPDVLRVEKAEKPVCGAGQVLVRTKAVSINPVDYKVRSGQLKLFTGRRFPKVPGADFSGEVVEVGSNVNDFQVGDQVFGMLNAFKGGTCAEYILANPGLMALKSERIGFEDAAALPVAALTALQGLRDAGKIKEENRVLINGSSGGVGHFAVQIAKALNAHVTAVCSNRNVDFSKNLGADQVIDYTKDDPLETNEKYDIFFDVVSNTPFSKAKPVLSQKGVYIATLPAPLKILQSIYTPLTGGQTVKLSAVKTRREDFDTLTGLMNTNKLKSVISKTYPLKDIQAAHEEIESGHVRGKIVVTF